MKIREQAKNGNVTPFGIALFIPAIILLLGPMFGFLQTAYSMTKLAPLQEEVPSVRADAGEKIISGATTTTVVGLAAYPLGVILTLLVAKLGSLTLARKLRRFATGMAILLLFLFPLGTILGSASLASLFSCRRMFQEAARRDSSAPSDEP